MGAKLLGHGIRQPPFGQFGEQRRVQDHGHKRSVAEDEERKHEVKFLHHTRSFSVEFLMMLQDEILNFQKLRAARLLMPGTRARFSGRLCLVLWADDKSKPYKN